MTPVGMNRSSMLASVVHVRNRPKWGTITTHKDKNVLRPSAITTYN